MGNMTFTFVLPFLALFGGLFFYIGMTFGRILESEDSFKRINEMKQFFFLLHNMREPENHALMHKILKEKVGLTAEDLKSCERIKNGT